MDIPLASCDIPTEEVDCVGDFVSDADSGSLGGGFTTFFKTGSGSGSLSSESSESMIRFGALLIVEFQESGTLVIFHLISTNNLKMHNCTIEINLYNYIKHVQCMQLMDQTGYGNTVLYLKQLNTNKI